MPKTHYRPGLCECGCGGETNIAMNTNKTRGDIKGQPVRFIRWHHNKLKPKGELSPGWKGGIQVNKGYIRIKTSEHPFSDANGFVAAHRLVAEKAAGFFFHRGIDVHHVDSIKNNNINSNLVVCQDRAYHFLLHQRKRALDACGNPSWRKCRYCKEYDSPENLILPVKTGSAAHTKCNTIFKRRN